MNKYLFFLFIAMCNINYCLSQDINIAPDKYLVTGQLSNVPDGTKIGLYREDGQLIVPVLQDTIMNGVFTFSDTVSCTKKLLLISAEKGFPSNWLNVWVAPGKHITITGSDKLICIWGVKSDIPEQLEENNYVACAWKLRKEYLKHDVVAADWLKQMGSKEYADDQDFSKLTWAKVDSIRQLSFPLQRSVFKEELSYMKTAPISRIWMEKMVLYAQMSQGMKFLMPFLAELKELYFSMPKSVKQTADAQLVYQYLFPAAAVGIGDEMVDGELYDTQGTVHHLSEFNGKYILLDFWSRGCGPCLDSFPEMEEIITMYQDKLEVISISIDSEKHWKEFIKEKKLEGNQWNELRRANTGLAASYQVKGYPHYVLIAPDGKIQEVWGGYGKGSLLNKMKEYLNK